MGILSEQTKGSQMVVFPQTLSPNAACKRANRRGYKTTRIKDKITLYDRNKENVLLKDASPNEVNDWLHHSPVGAPEND